ncbi:hypothetical protein CHARACLAT_009129 [Characodon lateralis]|uniref:Uncharacterized protein n=1 Tax=Characodon lateralis TaxID=208331 RepID=A0ABU7CPW2_9TELE|nr:hypothetical protein [Characodon lateralis]
MPRRIKAVLKAKGGPTRYWQGVPNKVADELTVLVFHKFTVLGTSGNRTVQRRQLENHHESGAELTGNHPDRSFVGLPPVRESGLTHSWSGIF